MKKIVLVCIGLLIIAFTYLFGVKGYDAFEYGYLYSQKNHNRCKTLALFASDIADSRQKKYNWTKEQRDSFKQHYIDSVWNEVYDRGIYLPFLTIFEETKLDR